MAKIFTKYITLRNGRRLYAWQKGKKAFCIEVPDDKGADDKKTTFPKKGK